MIGPGHDRLPPAAAHCLGDLRGIGGDSDGADPGLDGPTPHMDDHGLAPDIGQGLVRQTGGAQAGGDEDGRIGFMGPRA